MIVIPFIVGFVIIGWMRATKAGGKRADKLQFAAAHGMAGLILGLVITMLLDWQGWI